MPTMPCRLSIPLVPQDSVQQAFAPAESTQLELNELGGYAGLRAALRAGSVILSAKDVDDHVITETPATLWLADGAKLTAWRTAERLELDLEPLPAPPRAGPFALPEAHGLPAPVADQVRALSAGDQPEAAAGLCVRWAWSTAEGCEHPLYALATGWWDAQDADVHTELEGLVLTGAVQLEADVEALGAEPLPLEVIESLALRRDALASACSLLFARGAGRAAREVERSADRLLGALVDAQAPAGPYPSPLLDALARRDLGWWTLAPHAPAPPLDEDTFLVDDPAELDLLDDLAALADEEAHADTPSAAGPADGAAL